MNEVKTVEHLTGNEFGAQNDRVAIVNLITQTSMTRMKAPVVNSNKDAMIVNFVRELKRHGLAADIFIADAYKPKGHEDVGITLRYLPTRLKLLFWPSCIPFTPTLTDELKNKYDIVVCSELFQVATVLAVLAKIFGTRKMKIIVWQELAKHQRLAGQTLSKFYHSVLVKFFIDKHIDLYIPRGELAKQFLMSQGIHPDKISGIISHGIDPAKFYYDPAVRKERYIFCPSRLVYAKGIDVLLKAFAIVCQEALDLELVIQGNGPNLTEYERLARDLGVEKKVIFCTERVSHDEMRQKYQKALLTVIASRADNIIFSDMESVSCGTPVIISDGADSHMNFLDRKGGVVFPKDDHAFLAKLILSFINEPYRRSMEALALEKAKVFNNEHLASLFRQTVSYGVKKESIRQAQ